MSEIKSVIDMNCEEARKFFLKNESYCNLQLPPYYDFSSLLNKLIGKFNNQTNLKSLNNGERIPNDLDDVNYNIFKNKDGKYGWRKFQLIHPVLYTYLVFYITKENIRNKILQRIKKCKNDGTIECVSRPKENLDKDSDTAGNISSRIHCFEEESISLSLDFKYLFKTDISGCYGSIYTHSIPWALHGKLPVKLRRKNEYISKSFYGNGIDHCIQAMSYGQTNGIPEGSTLMDFIAELVLGYLDSLLFIEIDNLKKGNAIWKNSKYKILRYRDDYHIFVNDPEFGKEIVKKLSGILSDFGMKLNNEKTISSDNVIGLSVKKDKIERIINFDNLKIPSYKKDEQEYVIGLKKSLLIINHFSEQFPNTGSVLSQLNELSKNIEGKKIKSFTDIKVLISILINIGCYSPKAYPPIFNILSWFISYIDKEEDKLDILNKVYEKLSRLPKSEYLDIWIQRLKFDLGTFSEEEKICKQVSEPCIEEIWNNKWLNNGYRKIIQNYQIVDYQKYNSLDHIITRDETKLFSEYPF